MVLRRSWAKRVVESRNKGKNIQHPKFNIQRRGGGKIQFPSSKIQGRSKCQDLIIRFGLVLGAWIFPGSWNLEIGSFCPRSFSGRLLDTECFISLFSLVIAPLWSPYKSDTLSLFPKMNRENSMSPTHPHFQAPACMLPASRAAAH